jgi:hypothetical protein
MQSAPQYKTTRIEVVAPRHTSAPAANRAKALPVIPASDPQLKSPSILIAADEQIAPANALDSIPMPLCWSALGVSALLFLLQLLIYIS